MKVIYKIELILFAIVGTYLIMSVPFVNAININILHGGFSESAVLDPGKYVIKEYTIEHDEFWSSVDINIELNNGTSEQIQKVYIYKCRGMNPEECIKTSSYDSFSGNFNQTYNWDDIADQTAYYPQKANLLYLVKLSNNYGPKWLGFWDQIKRSERTFPGTYLYSYSLNSMDVYAKNINFFQPIKTFIQERTMVPFNSSWVERVVLSGMNFLYEIKTNEPPSFATENHSSNQISSPIDRSYSFVFSNTSTETFNPVTLNINPSYICGNGDCETDLGETQSNCCYDCGCPGNFYCENSVTCKSLNGIVLSLAVPPATVINNCNVDHELEVIVQINNPPAGVDITDMAYYLNTTNYALTCSGGPGTNYVYACPITVPADPGCGEGEYVLGPNSIVFDILFPDGPETRTKSISVGFPDITLGSWSCGENGCETDLGETQSNCCYDCGCPRGQYCDIVNQANTGRCKADISDANLDIMDVNPTHLYAHDPAGDSVNFIARVTNSPSILSADPSCSIDCEYDGSPCTSSCTLRCTEEESSDPDIYNSSCAMNFSISGYDPLLNYNLYPKFNYSLRYMNGSIVANKILSKNIPTITIGAHWCGDMNCGPDEDSVSCCYDCGCSVGQYCDTQDASSPTNGDSCRQLDSISITVGNIPQTSFTDSRRYHKANVSLYVYNKPSGFIVNTDCDLAGGNITCTAPCFEQTSTDPSIYNATCQITIPPMDYSTSPYYNSVTNKMTLTQNSLNISLEFNNGPIKTIKNFIEGFGDIQITPIPQCGDGYCESNLGESVNNCCVDCPCRDVYGSGHFCYTGTNVNGDCVATSNVQLEITGFDPDPVNCTIFEFGDECRFVESVDLSAHIVNAASDMEILGSYYTYNGEDYDLYCFATPSNQTEYYTCSITIPEPEETDEGEIEKEVGLTFIIKYSDGFETITQNISAASTLKIQKVKSEELRTCEEERAGLDSKISGLEKDKRTVETIISVFIALAAGLWVACALGCGWCCKVALWLGCAAACLASILLPQIEKIKNEVSSLKAQRDKMCRSSNYRDFKSGVDGSFGMGGTLVSLILGIVCVVCLFQAVSGMSGGKEAATAEGGAIDVSGATWHADAGWEGGGYWDMGGKWKVSAGSAGVAPAPVH